MTEASSKVVSLHPQETKASLDAKKYFEGIRALQDLDRLGRMLRTDLSLARNAIGNLNSAMAGLSVNSTDDLINLHGTRDAALILLLVTAVVQSPEVEHHIHGEDSELETRFRSLLKATV